MFNKPMKGRPVDAGPLQPALSILSGVVRAIAKEPERVEAQMCQRETCSAVVLEVSPRDFALLHERDGSTVGSLRIVAAALSVRLKSEIVVEVIEKVESERN